MKLPAKITLLLLGAGLAALPAVRADEAPPPPVNGGPGGQPGPGQGGQWGERMKERQDKIMQELNLTADQQAKWKSIGQEEMKALGALRNDTSIPEDQKRGKMMELRKNFDGQRRALLTADQQAKFDELRAKMRERRRNWGGPGGQGGQNQPPPPPPQNGT